MSAFPQALDSSESNYSVGKLLTLELFYFSIWRLHCHSIVKFVLLDYLNGFILPFSSFPTGSNYEQWCAAVTATEIEGTF